MTTVLHVVEVFHVANRTLIAVDEDGGELRFGDHFRSDDGSEFVVRAVAFSSPKAWAAGRRGVEVEVVKGHIVAGQNYSALKSSNQTG